MNKIINTKKITCGRVAVRTLASSASTLALFDLIRGEIQAGGLLALGWLAIVIGEKRMFNVEKKIEDT